MIPFFLSWSNLDNLQIRLCSISTHPKILQNILLFCQNSSGTMSLYEKVDNGIMTKDNDGIFWPKIGPKFIKPIFEPVLLGAILWLWPPSILWRCKRDMSIWALLFYPDAKFRQMATTACVVLRHTGRGERRRIWKMSINAGGPLHAYAKPVTQLKDIHMGVIWKAQQGTASFASPTP